MIKCFSVFKMWDEYQAKKRRKEILLKADSMFQVCEHEAELWLVHDGSLVCPCSMLSVEPVHAVRVMREMYITNNTNQEEL